LNSYHQIVPNTEPVQHKILNVELRKLKKMMLCEVQKPSLSRLLRHLISHNANFRHQVNNLKILRASGVPCVCLWRLCF